MHSSKSIYFPGLNGLRAIAALSVLFAHTTLGLKYFGLDSFVFGKYPDGSPKATLLAGFGVSIFFAISGFLITFLLTKENEKQPIQIRKFYIRRILRIWPLYFLYLVIVILTLLAFNIEFENSSIAYYVLLSANVPFVFGNAIEFLGHYWSLGVEEQFYLFWPNFLKRSSNFLTSAMILCIILILVKIIVYLLSSKIPKLELLYTFIHVTRFQCMIIGAIGGLLYFKKNKLFMKLLNQKITQLIAWTIILLVAVNKFHLISVLDNEFISLVTVVLIIGQIEKKNRLINLENKLFDFLGKISFGIYVIHPLLIFYISKLFHFDHQEVKNYILVYSVVTVATVGIAYVLYTFFESPILKLKSNYTVIESKSTMSG
ncbi:MAG: acyltransferase [Bacteroidota bacterium]|nr:acyltransferase [Bacteroidota bacterium]